MQENITKELIIFSIHRSRKGGKSAAWGPPGGGGWLGGLGGFFLTPGFVLMNNIAAKAKAKRVPLFFIFFLWHATGVNK